MPWVKAENAPRNIGAPVAPPAAAVTQDLAEPGFGETIGAAWRSQNIIGSTINNKMLGADLDTVDPDFDPFEASKGTRYEEYPERLSSIFNRKAYEAFTAQVDMEDEDRRTLDAAGGFGILAQVGAGIMDPTILIPAGSLIRSGKVGYSLSRSALSVGTGAAVGVGVQEGVLQSTQETRTATESALAIGGGAILGALVGVAGAKILDNVAWNDLSRRLSADLAQRGPLPIDVNDAEMKGLVEASRGQLASAGAAAVTRDTIDALSVAGRAAQVAVGPVARLNPLLRALSSPSARTREIMLSMMENPVYIKKNFEGGASAQSVETYVKEAQARYTIAYESTVDEWKAARKAGAALPWDEFRRRIGQAMRNNDVDPGGNAFVSKAAERWRKDVFDPLKNEAIDAGLLPEGIEAGTAPSYFHRMYNTRLIEANEKEFRQIVREWATEAFDAQTKRDGARLQRRAGNLQAEADEIEMGILRRQSSMAERASGGEVDVDPETERGILSALRALQAGTKKPPPQSLTQFLASKGGLWDPDGELEAIGISSKTRPGFVRRQRAGTVNKNGGIDLDAAARMAWEEGFLPGLERPTPADLLDALSDDFNGRRRIVREADRDAVAGAELQDRIASDLERMGIDTGAKNPMFSTSEDLKGLVQRIARAQEMADRARADELRRVRADIEQQIATMASRGSADAVARMEFDSYIEEVVESIFNKITGRTLDEQGENPFRIVATRRGPLKERTFNIEDARIAKFLEDDVEMVGRRYTRMMGADVELSRMSARLGGSGKADLADLTDEIRKEYAELRKGAKTEREINRLADRERNDIRDMNAVRDMLRGSYLPEQNSSGYARIINAAMTFNYMRALGGVVVSSMSDIARPLMVHGLGRYMNAGIKPLVTNLKAFRLSAREAKLSGVVGERVRNAMLATYAELTDPYARSSPFERFLDNSARGFSRLTGMPVWNDFMKSFSAVITQDRILGNAAKWGGIKESERAYMQFLGLDQSMAERIARQFAEHGETLDGVRVAHTDEWTDDVARRFYRAAVNKDVDSIIVTKGVGDVPLFAKTPTGRALLQFKGFALASHQRALVRGLQEDKLSMLSGLIAMTAIGSFIYYLKSVESNRWGDLSDNPGRFLAEGLDRSGFLSIPFEVNNTAEKIGAPGVYTGLQALFPDAMQKQPASRYAVRSVVDAALGPSVGLAKDVLDMAGAAARADLSPSDVNTMRRLTPGASLPIIRSLIEYGVMPEAKEAVQ